MFFVCFLLRNTNQFMLTLFLMFVLRSEMADKAATGSGGRGGSGGSGGGVLISPAADSDFRTPECNRYWSGRLAVGRWIMSLDPSYKMLAFGCLRAEVGQPTSVAIVSARKTSFRSSRSDDFQA